MASGRSGEQGRNSALRSPKRQIRRPPKAATIREAASYVGIGIVGGVYTKFDDELEDQLAARGVAVTVEADATVGFKAVGGNRLSPHIAIEMEYEMLSEADVDVSGVGVIGGIQTWTLTGNAKWLLTTG